MEMHFNSVLLNRHQQFRSNFMSNLIGVAKGINGHLYIYEDRIVIVRKGFFGLSGSGNAGNKEIPINQISAIQYRKAGLFKGFIYFSCIGDSQSRMSFSKAYENLVMFSFWANGEFESAKNIIDEQMACYHPINGQTEPVETDIQL
jgi:hypothetical protein